MLSTLGKNIHIMDSKSLKELERTRHLIPEAEPRFTQWSLPSMDFEDFMNAVAASAIPQSAEPDGRSYEIGSVGAGPNTMTISSPLLITDMDTILYVFRCVLP